MGASTSAILDAVNSGTIEEVRETLNALKKEGVENLSDFLDYADEEGKTSLHWAAIRGDTTLVKELLLHGAKTSLVDDQGNTPLDSAVFLGNKDAAEALLDGGADINTANKDGMTALHWAVLESRFECIELLIRRGANLSLKNNKNQNPLEIVSTLKTKPRNKLEAFLNDVLQKTNRSPHPFPKAEKTASSSPASPSSSVPSSPSVVKATESDQPRLKRLVGLCKLWGLIKYLHPFFIDKKPDWDAALVQTLPRLTSATSTEHFKKIVNDMLGIVGDANTRCFNAEDLKQLTTKGLESESSAQRQPTGTQPTQPYVKFTEDKTAIVVATHHERFQDYSVMVNFLNCFKEAQSRGNSIVFDFRLKRGSSINFAAHPFKFMIFEAIKTLLDRTVSLPSYRQRIYSGYPQQRNFGNVFHSGMMVVEAEQLHPTTPPDERLPMKRWVFLINKFTPDSIVDLIAGLQAANLTRVVFEKFEGDVDMELGVPFFNLPLGEDLVVHVRKNQRVNANSSLGFVPDLIVQAEGQGAVDAPLLAALKVANGADTQAPPVQWAAVYLPRAVDEDYSSMVFPAVEYRLLALFRFWNIIQYFFPYRDLMDREWETVLVEFIPKLEKVTSALEYHLTIAELVAQCSDSHATCTSSVLNAHLGTHFPPVEVRLVEGKTVVTHLFTDVQGNKPVGLALGDEIVTIDGEDVNSRKRKLSAVLSASTPQALQWKIHQKLLCGEKDSRIRIEARDRSGQIVSVPLTRSMHQAIAKKSPEPPNCYVQQNGLIGYINTVTMQPSELEKALETVKNTKCLILDIRGYPKGIIYQIAPRLIKKSVTVAVTQTPLLLPDFLYSELESCMLEEKHRLHPSSQWKYTGKVIALINEDTMSHAEHSCLYLESCTDVTFIGTTSNGANGNVSNCHLPGGILVAFTGLGALHGNKTQLQRKGITPDVLVHPTIEGVRTGKDEIFEKAIEYSNAIFKSSPQQNGQQK